MTGSIGKARRVAAKRELALEVLRDVVRRVERERLTNSHLARDLPAIVAPLIRAGMAMVDEEASVVRRRGRAV